MYRCQICNKQFKTSQSLVSHLSHPKSKCKIDIKLYYNKFLRKSNEEGICKYCKKETHFESLSKGYPSCICGKCSNKDPNKNRKRSTSIKNTLRKKKELKDIKIKLINLLRIQTINPKNKCQCQICGIIFPNINYFTKHVKIHKIKLKDYYNKYFKSQNEDICLCYKEVDTCEKYTKFINFEKGYSDYCSTRCVASSCLIYDSKQKNCLNKYGVIHPTKDPKINKRQIKGIRKTIKKHKNEIIEKRKQTCQEKYNVDYISQVENIKIKKRKSFEIYYKSEDFKKRKESNFKKYFQRYFSLNLKIFLEKRNLKILDKYKGSHLKYNFKCLKCGYEFKQIWNSIQQL